MKNGRKGRIIKLLKDIAPALGFFAALLVLTAIFYKDVASLATDEGREAFTAWIRELGFLGWFLALLIQLLQIFVAFLPGEPIEILLGYAFGPYLGTFTCLFGIFIGTLVILLLVRRFGRALVTRAVGEEGLGKYAFLSNEERVELTVFILFFIPGTPKDALSYIAPLLPLKPVRYLIISTFARIPSVLTSTVLGDRLAEGDFTAAIIVFLVTAVISLLGIFVGTRFVRSRSEDRGKDGKIK